MGVSVGVGVGIAVGLGTRVLVRVLVRVRVRVRVYSYNCGVRRSPNTFLRTSAGDISCPKEPPTRSLGQVPSTAVVPKEPPNAP